VTTLSGSERYVVDSSGWVEYLGNGPKADAFAKYLEAPETLLLPTIIVYEVYKKMLVSVDRLRLSGS
jgi:predicted nucleic acid-binding protein